MGWTLLNIVCAIVALVLAFGLGWFIRGAGKKFQGILDVVEWEEGEPDVLLRIDEPPTNFVDGQQIFLLVHKTSRTRG